MRRRKHRDRVREFIDEVNRILRRHGFSDAVRNGCSLVVFDRGNVSIYTSPHEVVSKPCSDLWERVCEILRELASAFERTIRNITYVAVDPRLEYVTVHADRDTMGFHPRCYF